MYMEKTTTKMCAEASTVGRILFFFKIYLFLVTFFFLKVLLIV